MKKMNLSFLGLKAKMVLPLFLLIGLFLVSANTSSAQLLSSEKGYYESVSKHVNELPVTISMALPIVKSSKEAINNPKITDDAKTMLDKTFGELILAELNSGIKHGKAIENTYNALGRKIPAEYLDTVSEFYKNLQ
jgi:F0F1-type ATP synthase membrane subunit a